MEIGKEGYFHIRAVSVSDTAAKIIVTAKNYSYNSAGAKSDIGFSGSSQNVVRAIFPWKLTG